MEYLLLIPILILLIGIIYRMYLYNKIRMDVDTSRVSVFYWWRGDIIHYFSFTINIDADLFHKRKSENLSIAIENVNKIKKLKSKI